MPREFSRSERVADAIQRELATLIQMEMRDPRIGMVNITAVEVSRDLSHARVFVTFVDHSDTTATDVRVAILNRAAGYLRNLLGKTLQTRVVPSLAFRFDESVERGAHLSELIDEAIRQDASHHASDDTE